MKRPGSPETEQKLIRSVLNNHPGAFEELIGQYQRLIAHIVYRLISGRESREDLIQEILLKIYRNLPGFRHRSRLSTWIAKIAYHSCINYLQKKKSGLIADKIPEEESVDDHLIADTPSPLSYTEQADLSRRLEREIDKLPPVQKAILTFYHLDSLSYREIGEILNLPEGTVKSYLFRARRRLKDQLTSTYQLEELI